MLPRFRWILLLAATVVVLSTAVVRADNEGQEDLDQATDKKLSATTPDDLSQVIDLCESAMKKGLDQANTEFAKNLLTSTLMQRANFLAKVIVDRTPRDWPKLRQMALDDLTKALKTQPDLPAAQLQIARLEMLPGGDRVVALKAAEKAAELAKDDPSVQVDALVLQAKVVSEPAKIEELLTQALKIAPHNDEVLVYRGRLLLEQGKADDALTDLTAATKSNPENAEAQETRGQALFALKRNDEAVKAFDEAIKLVPDSSSPYVERARVHLQSGQLDDALSDVNEAIKLDSKNSAAILLRACVHQQQGDAKAAEADVDEIFKEAKEGSELSPVMRVLFSPGSGGLRQTITDLEQLTQVAPKNTELLSELGSLYTLRKQPHKAIEKFSAALEIDPKFFSALRGRADAYLSVGKHAEAIADYNEALKLKPEDPGVLNNLAWVLATSPDEGVRDGKRAIELATKAAKLTDNKQAHILSTLAAAYAETGDFDKAAEWSKKAVDIGSEDPETNDQLKKELASYGEKKPWREKQDMQDTDDAPKSADNSSAAKKE
jgi:tetratricopeptide (TPR) repeat protein